MRLVSFQQPIFDTIQGEGSLVGALSTFVRLWGCDFSCPWCDTKKSWEPGSTYVEKTPLQVAEEVLSHTPSHVVVTGGNPLLQNQELSHLLALLYDQRHITLETQGTYKEGLTCLKFVHLLSLSPKLHDWRWGELSDVLQTFDTLYIFDSRSRSTNRRGIQIKLVCCDEADIEEALTRFNQIRCWSETAKMHHKPQLFIQPVYQNTRKVTKLAMEILLRQQIQDVKILPQVHKTGLFVE